MKNSIIIFLVFLLLFSCEKPKVRKPIVYKSSVSQFDKTILLHQNILKRESELFQKIIEQDTLHNYIQSPFGFYYFYNKKNGDNFVKAKSKDDVIINYEIRDVNNKILISQDELGSENQENKSDRLLRIDAEDFVLGLHHGLKLMKEGEIVTFLIPSNLAFGATGLQGKIASNQVLIVKVKLKQILNK